MKKKFSKITIFFLTTLELSVVLLLINEKKSHIDLNSLRTLKNDEPISMSDIEKTQSICRDADDDIHGHFFPEDFQNEDGELITEIEDKFDKKYLSKSRPRKSGKIFEAILDFVDGKGLGAKTFIKLLADLKLYFAFFFFGVLSFFGWIASCICLFRPCCCCKQTVKREKIFKIISYFVMFSSIATVIILSSIGLSKSVKITKEFSGLSCSILSTVITFLNGEKKEKIPKWSGTTEIIEELSDIINVMHDIVNRQTTEDDIAQQMQITRKDDFIQTVTDHDTFYATDTGSKPFSIVSSDGGIGNKAYNPFGPSYLNDLTPSTGEGTFYNQVLNSFNDLIDNGYFNTHISYESVNNIHNNIENVITQKEAIKELFYGFEKDFGKIFSDYSSIIFDYKDYFTTYAEKGFKIFFGLSMGLSLVIVLYEILIMVNVIPNIKIATLIILNISILLTLFNFFLAGYVGSIGKICSVGSEVLMYVLSQENLLPRDGVLFWGDTASKINVCINSDGNLAKEYGLDNSLKDLNILYKLKQNFTNIEELLTQTKGGADPNNKENELRQKFAFDVLSPETTEILEYFNSIMAQNYDTIHNKISKTDDWHDDKIYCKAVYTSNLLTSAGGDDPKCFIFNEQDPDVSDTLAGVNNRYTDYKVTVSGTDLNTIVFIKRYLKFAKKIRMANDNFFNVHVKQKDAELETKFNRVHQSLNDSFINQKKYVDIAYNSLNHLLGEEGETSDILNCHFLEHNFEMIRYTLDEGFGKLVMKIATFLGFATFCQAISLIFFMILKTRFKGNPSQNGYQSGDMSSRGTNPFPSNPVDDLARINPEKVIEVK